MTTKCHYCKYHTDIHSYCHKCSCYSFAGDFDARTVMFLILKNDKGYTKQYEVHNYITTKFTKVMLANTFVPVLELKDVVLTPQNVRQKLSLYLALL